MNFNTYNNRSNYPAVYQLIIINIAVFIFQKISFLFGTDIISIFGLIPALVVRKFMLWQFITYLFLHGGFWHILFNMLGLWFFGRELEYIWGKQQFLKFYFITGIGAGIFVWITGFNSYAATIGASGAILGILTAYAIYFPHRYVYLYALIPIKVKYLVWFYAVLSFFKGMQYSSDGIAHYAHLGGIIIAFVYLKINWHKFNFFSFKKWYNDYNRYRLKRIDRKRREEFVKLKKQVDEILDKISKYGMESLSKKEKKTLEKASEKLRNFNKTGEHL